MADFVEHLPPIIRSLQNMLKKNAPPWSFEQIKAVQKIKQKVQWLLALVIPTDGKIILQNDVSDLYHASTFLEEKDRNWVYVDAKLEHSQRQKNIIIPLSVSSYWT